MTQAGFEARGGSFFGTDALVETGQFGTQRRVFFGDPVGMRLQTLEIAAGFFESFFAIETGLLFFGHQRLALIALGAGTLILAAQAVELQSRYREALAGASVLL